MTTPIDSIQQEIANISQLLQKIEARVGRLERYLGLEPKTEPVVPVVPEGEGAEQGPVLQKTGSSLELRIGEYWLAQFGTIVLLLGMAFIISYPFESIPALVISLFGYLAVAGIFALSRYWREIHKYLSEILYGGGLFLLYYTTLRLHFFAGQPVLSNRTAGIIVIALALSAILFLSMRRESPLFTGAAFFLFCATSLIFDSAVVSPILMTLTAALICYVLVRHGWLGAAVTGMLLVYLAYLLWIVNNPFLGKPIQIVGGGRYVFYFLLISGALFGSAITIRREAPSRSAEFLVPILVSVALLGLSSLVIVNSLKQESHFFYLLITAVFLLCACWVWLRHGSQFAAAIYALSGFLALSIAIFIRFQSPDYFVWLSWQSLLAVSSALWFRSRIIIVVNFLIYLAIFLIYLFAIESNVLVNGSYALVALTSARILNWQQARLQLKTDMIRNAYLASAFVIVLYGLQQAVPGNFVSLSWLAAAIVYFGLSLTLKNLKYRWLAILTLLAVVVHIFLIDTARLGAELRIPLFLAVGFVLLLVSMLYSKYRRRFSQE